MAEKLKIPGESTTNPSFAAPQVQTAPDVATSQKVAGIAASPTTSSVPNENSTVIPPGVAGAQSTTVPPAPKATATVSSGTGPAAAPATATVPTSTGAPPGVPATAPPPVPTVGMAPTPKSIQGHNAAEDDFIQAQNETQMKLYEAAMAYNGGPTGALQSAQRASEQGLRASTNNRGAAGTIESSLYGDDKSLIAQNRALSDTKAYTTYQETVNGANAALNKAQIAYARATEQEKREIAEQAEKREQTEAMEKATSAASMREGAATVPGSISPYGTPAKVNGPVGPGGVVPREYKSPSGGFVRIGGRKR